MFDPSGLSDGTYTLHVTARNSDTGCESAESTASLVINNQPELSFASIAAKCFPADEFEVKYTPSADAESFTYVVMKGSTEKQGEKTITVDASKKFTLNTSGWAAGTYTINAIAKSSKNCYSEEATVTFTIKEQPEAGITSVESKCIYNGPAKVVYTASANATKYSYTVYAGSTEKLNVTDQTISSPKEFTIDIASLGAGSYTLRLTTWAGDCPSVEATKDFTVYPRPTLTLDPTYTTSAGVKVCYPVAKVEIPYTSTDADTYTYELTVGSGTRTDTKSASASGGNIEVNTAGLSAGDYALSVTATSENGCVTATAQTTVIKIKPQPSLELTAIDDVCEGTSGVSTTVTLHDASKYNYDVLKNGVVMSAQHKEDQTSASISLSTGSWEPDTYTVQVTAISGDNCGSEMAEVSFAIHPNPTITSLTDEVIVCEKTDHTASFAYEMTSVADKYDYSLEGTDIHKENQSVGTGGKGKIEFDPSGLSDGTYTLHVTARNSDTGCESAESTASLVINNQPELSFASIAAKCFPADEFEVKYTPTDAVSFTYIVMKGSSTQKGEEIITVDASKKFTLNTSGWGAGDYTINATAKSSNNCYSDEATVTFTINEQPTAGITSVESKCIYEGNAKVVYTASANATKYSYSIYDGSTEKKNVTNQTISSPKEFTIDIASLGAGSYTLHLTTWAGDCPSVEATKDFTVYPRPTLTLDPAYTTSAGVKVCYPVAKVEIPYISTNADTYTYVLTVGSSTRTDTKSASASGGNIEVNTDGLPAGEYALSVTATSEQGCVTAATQTTTIHINPRPTFTFKPGEVRDCHPSTGINVGYTSTNAKTYSYTLTLEGESSSALAEDDLTASADGVIALNTTELAAGTYDLEVTAKSEHGCDILASVSRKVIIQAKPTADIDEIIDQCDYTENVDITFKAEYASQYRYMIDGETNWTNWADMPSTKSFTLEINELNVGDASKTYTLMLQTKEGDCTSDIATEPFTILPIPKVKIDKPDPIRSDVTSIDVKLEFTNATVYDYSFVDENDALVLGQTATGVSITNNPLTLNTTNIGEGKYTLKVTPHAACHGTQTTVEILVNNKPSISIEEPEAVCEGTNTIDFIYTKSADAARFIYNIEQAGTPQMEESQTVDLTSSPLTIDISSLTDYGTYTLKGHVESVKSDGTTLERGDDEEVNFIILAKPEKKQVTQDVKFIGCGEEYTATIEVKIFNAAGRKIVAEYSDNGSNHSKPFATSAGEETAMLTLSELKDVGTTAGQKKTVTVSIEGAGCGITVEYEMPQRMTINQVSAVCADKSCDQMTDIVSGTVLTNCNVGVVRVEDVNDASNFDDIDLTTADRTYQLTILSGNTPKVKAYFLGKTCEPVEKAYIPTTMPEASINATVSATLPCDVTTFDLPFSLNYKYQGEGTLTVWVEDFPEKAKTFTSAGGGYTALDPGSLTLNGKIEGLPADGRTGKKLYFKFDGANSCADEITLNDFPKTPVIKSVLLVKDVEYIEGLTGEYYPTVTVTYENAKDQTIVLEYFDKDDQPKYAESPVIDSDEEGSYVFDKTTATDWSFDDVTMVDRVVHAYFKGSDFDNCHEGGTHDYKYDAPTNCAIKFESIDPLINRSTCDHLSYDLTGKVSFVGVARGDLIVELTLDGKTFSGKIDHELCVPDTELPFEIKNITKPIPDGGTQLTAYFLDLKTNTTILDYNVSTPVIPTVKVENATYSTPQCNESVVSLTFDLKYTRQQGNLYLSWDNQQCVYEILTGEPLMFSDDTLKATIVIMNITADQKEHRLWVAFGGTNCSDEVLIPAAPYSPKVTSAKAEMSDVTCDKDTYTLNVSFTVENSLGKDATLAFRGTPIVVTSEDGIHYAHSFTDVLRTLDDSSDDIVEVSFAGNDADCSGALYSIAYTETPKPAISLTLAADQGTTTCSDRTYRLQGEIRYTYLDQTPEIWLDEEAHRAITVQTMQADEQVINLADLINVPADGREHHVYIKPNGWADACSIDVPFNALQQPIITAAEVSGVPAFISCGETYPATVTVDYVHAFGKTITVACTDNGSMQTYTSAAITDNDGQTVITLPSLSDHDGVTALSIYIDDETCAYTSASIKQPKLNTIEPDFAVNVSATPCGVVDYAVWGTIKFNNAVGLGELIVKTEDGVQADVTIKTATSAEFRIEHYTVAGTAMQLTAYFENAATCFVLSAPYDSPDVPDLTLDGTAVDTVFTCGDKSYTVSVAFTPTNQYGTGYVLDSIANGAVRTVEMINATATAAQFVIARPAKAEQHFVVVRYPAMGCEVISQALDINAYTKPKPLISLTAIDRLCNNETELILPLVITQGDIDEATLTLTNSKGEKVITAADMLINAAHDTLSYNLPSQLAAGKYTATVDARDTLGCETSATQSVEFAIDGVVFSKWTDVLLVDNAGGLFTGYQWYENDKLLEGKTDQVLYLPEGMSGKSYYCVLQTAEGAIYTCVSDFGDLPRSADNPKTQSANHITVLPNRVATNGAVTVHQSLDENLHLILMSATGKRVAEYNQTDATKLIDMPGVQGIYLLRIETESDVQTVKIVVY
ncbi:MAG: T9SS type A sorting domain-containing protein [Paludibacteraceae bacterium]|nr:T9SS type A sorting domain-containing protein [Paludibacteraceae bacterium]